MLASRFFWFRPMLTFTFRSEIADVDETLPSDPFHPTIVILIDTGETFCEIIVPDDVLAGRREMLYPERPVVIAGKVIGFPVLHIASTLELPDTTVH